MDEVDTVLFEKLTEIGCKLPDKIDSLCDLPHSYALPVAQKCLDRINGEDEETIIPDSKGDQVLLASKLAATCKDLGYEGELGYDLFIYPNEEDLRSVLTFLINKLSIESKRDSISDLADVSLMQRISQKIKEELDKPWTPLYCKPKGFMLNPNGVWTRDGCCYAEPFQSVPFKITRDTKNITHAFVEYWKNTVPSDTNNDLINEPKDSPEKSIKADIILKKIKSKGSFSFNMLSSLITPTNDLNEEIETVPLQNEAETLEIDINNLSIDTLYDENERGLILNALSSNEELNMDKIKMLEEKINNNIHDVKDKITAEKRIIAEYEKNLIEEKEEVKNNEIDVLEQRIKKKAQKLKKAKRNRNYLIISPDKERLIRANDITETIDRLTRMKADTSTMIKNVNSIQKDINRINGVLDRSFVVADEMIFKDAKKDEFARKTYKLVANVHTECNDLCDMVKEIGSFTRDTVVLEKNVETATRKNTKENLERATADLLNFSMRENDK